MENLFLAVIAFNALLSAVLVGALAYGMRLVNRKLDDLDAEVEQDVMPKLQEFVRVARQVADATADARRHVVRVGADVTARAEQVHRLLGGTLERVAGVAEQAAGLAGQMETEEDEESQEEATGAVR